MRHAFPRSVFESFRYSDNEARLIYQQGGSEELKTESASEKPETAETVIEKFRTFVEGLQKFLNKDPSEEAAARARLEEREQTMQESKPQPNAAEAKPEETSASLRETLEKSRARALPVNTVLKEESGLTFRKTAVNQWTAQGPDAPTIGLTDAAIDARAKEQPADLNDNAQFKEQIKDLPPLAQGILTFLRDLVRLLQGIKTNKEPINSQADLDRRTTELDTAREGIEKKLEDKTTSPAERKVLIKQRNELASQQRTANDQMRDVSKQAKELAVDIKRLAVNEGFNSIETSSGVDGIRVRGTSAEVRGLYSRIKGTEGAWMAIVGADGDPRQICEVRIPISKLSLQMMTPAGRPQQMMEGQRVGQRIDQREVSKPDWVREFPYKELAGSAGSEMLIVSFPPQLAEQAMNLPKNSTNISSIMISNSAPFSVDLYKKNENSQYVGLYGRYARSAGYTNLQQLTKQQRVARQNNMAAETRVRMALGIRVENTVNGTKITVPGKLREKGVKIDGINVV